MAEVKREEFTNYEKARVLGARALQIAMDAPLLKDIEKETLKEVNFNPMTIAEMEFEGDVLPITVNQPMPKKKAVKIKKTAEQKEKDRELIEKEKEEEKEIQEEGEIMELANPGDEEEPAEEKKEE